MLTLHRLSAAALICILAVTASYAALPDFSRHDLQYTQPAATWDEAFPLGNGTLGALVWGDGAPIKISLDRTDLWDLRPVPEFTSPSYHYATMRQWEKEKKIPDLLHLYEDPYNRPAPTKIPAGRITLSFGDKPSFHSARLALRNAAAIVHLKNADVEVRVHATLPIGLIRISGDAPFTPQLIAPNFAGGPQNPGGPAIVAGTLTQLGYPAAVYTHGDNWLAYEQQAWGDLKYAAILQWTRTPNQWIGVWSIASSNESPDPLSLARSRTQKALAEFDSQIQSHEEWWAHFWSQCWLSVPNPILERQWYLDTYKFGSASRQGAPPITLQGPWTADDGMLPPWKGDYHHDLNTELSYWPCYSGNHLAEGRAYVDWLWSTRQNSRAWTRQFFDMPGLNVPMTADLLGRQIGGWRQYTHSSTTAAWLAQNFYLYWKFSADNEFLKTRAYPYLHDCATFIEAVTSERTPDGLRTLPLSSSPEMHEDQPAAWFPTPTNYDLALIRGLLTQTAELSTAVGKPDEAAHWTQILSEIPPLNFDPDGGLSVAKNTPLAESHRHFSHLMAIHPASLIDSSQGAASQKIIQSSLAHLDSLGTSAWCGYSFAWLSSIAARAGDGVRAEHALEVFSTAFTLRNSFHCNGDQSGKHYSNFTYRPFTLEGNFAAAAGLQEMLLQSHTGTILLFPAIPSGWKDVEFHTLRAQGAFLISARLNDGKCTYLSILSEQGGDCRVKSPFTGKILGFSTKPGQILTLTGDPAG